MIEELIDTIQNIDCLIGMKKIPDKYVDLVLADPPYGISREINAKGQRLGTTAKLDFNYGEWDRFNEEWIDLAIKKTKGWFISFCAKQDITTYWKHLEENKFIALDVIAWVKPDPLPFNAKSRFVNGWEAIVAGKRPGAFWGSKYTPNVLEYQAPKNSERVHPTQKPLKLVRKLIELTTKPEELVLDPFMGSGTTAIACKQLDRHFIGFETDRKYYETALNRVGIEKKTSLYKFME